MKTKEKQSLREKGIQDLEKILIEKEQEIIKARNDMFRGRVKNIRSIKSLRNEIARTKTYIREKELV